MTKSIETAKIKYINSEELFLLFLQLQKAIYPHSFPFFITYIRAYSPIPGPLTLGNSQADLLMMSIFKQAYQSHQLLHQSAHSLRLQFNITKSQATQIVQACPSCQISAYQPP